ncbi:MAG: restriction endonuclease [Solirubrobacteraceae bacterium MAG38_C4-C5]|nr:restriction endonuclease [Candidatus Siliceabacter maunaloa]
MTESPEENPTGLPDDEEANEDQPATDPNDSGEVVVPRYWVMGTDRSNAEELARELREGRMRQGWGYAAELDLHGIAGLRDDGAELSSAQRDTWRRCRRLLPEQDDAMREGDIVVLPHLPRERRWSLARVTGGYRFEPLPSTEDHGHIREVELLYEGIDWDHPAADARLRGTMGNRQPQWNIDRLGDSIEHLLARLAAGDRPAEEAFSGDRLEEALGALAEALWQQLEWAYAPTSFERELVRRLLEVMFGEGAVDHTGGPAERGADFVCTHQDPLGTHHTVAVQVKMHAGDADPKALDQLARARAEYPLITSGVVLTTAEREPQEVAASRTALEQELGIPIRIILRRELLELFLRYLPELASPAGNS